VNRGEGSRSETGGFFRPGKSPPCLSAFGFPPIVIGGTSTAPPAQVFLNLIAVRDRVGMGTGNAAELKLIR